MNDGLLLAIDAGTGSCRALLFDSKGNLVASAQREYSHHAIPGVEGSQQFDIDANWKLICVCVREAMSRSGSSPDAVRAITATSMREGMVLYDARGRELWACPNVDARAARQVERLVSSGAAAEIYAHAGDWVAITAPARLLWIAENEPEMLASAEHVTMLGDWIIYRLSGEFVTDPSLGSSSGMFELRDRSWSPYIIELCGLREAMFPRVVEPGQEIGGLTVAAAADIGLRPGTPVVVAGADTQLGLVGIGLVAPGPFAIVGGTFWQHTMVVTEPLIDPEARLRTLCHTVPNHWMIEGLGFYSGLTMRWFRDAFCESDKAVAARAGIDVYEYLEGLAAEVPAGANGVLGIFSNLMDAKRWVHASPAFMQFDISRPETSGKKECLRAIEESAAYVSRGHLELIRELTATPIDEVVLAGGAANGTLWPQIVADVLGLPVRIPVVTESTSLGAAAYAALGVGMYRDIDEAVAGIVHFDRTVEPRSAEHDAYEQLYEQWRAVYARALKLSEAGLIRPLWRAAGT